MSQEEECSDRDLARSIEDWKRVRSEIEHEDNLTNHRLTWMFTSQAFLLTAFILLFVEAAKVQEPDKGNAILQFALLVTAGAGATVCVWIRPKLKAAESQIARLRLWWETKYPTGKTEGDWLESAHPPIIGGPVDKIDRLIINSRLPIVFGIGWGAFILCVIQEAWWPIVTAHAAGTATVLLGLLVLAIIFWFGLVLGRKKRVPPSIGPGTASEAVMTSEPDANAATVAEITRKTSSASADIRSKGSKKRTGTAG